jgi:hypothetical protein
LVFQSYDCGDLAGIHEEELKKHSFTFIAWFSGFSPLVNGNRVIVTYNEKRKQSLSHSGTGANLVLIRDYNQYLELHHAFVVTHL